MSLITATGLAKAFGAQDIFEEVSLAVPHQARLALVGPNGIGKTTLLHLLAGQERPDRGQVHRARGLRIGYLPQEAPAGERRRSRPEQTVWDCCLGALAELRAQETELARLEEAMADPRQAEEAMARYGPLQETFDRAGGYTYSARIRRVLNGLGFVPEEDSHRLDQLSGGERTRLELARLLLEDPDLLLLDEPTNHLDIEAVEWLEGWLQDWPGAVISVSHDRYFLDRTVDTVWELTRSGIEAYRGNYSAYQEQRLGRRASQLAAFRAQQSHVSREQDYIRRNIAGQNSRQAQGRRKRLERMLRDEAVARPDVERTVRLDLGSGGRSGDLVLETRDLAIGYADAPAPLFQVPDLRLTRGECAALIGPNGAGKTTFLKTLIGEVPAYAGRVRLGAALQLGYFEQTHAGLDPQLTVLEEVLAAAPRLSPAEARNFLARFLFSGEAVDKPVAVLSGGERGRVALAKLALQGANLLLLDEPTNHLDLPSQEVLQEALGEFPGTILLVSHDRYLIDALATQVWAVTPEAQRLQVFEGGYAAYAEARRQEAEARKAAAPPARPRPAAMQARRRLRADLEAVEARIARLEQEMAELARGLEVAGADVDRVSRLGRRYAELERELESTFAAWESLAQGQHKPA